MFLDADEILRYNMKIQMDNGRRCMDRWAASQDAIQPHNARDDGCIFTCQYCAFFVCTACDRPEHVGETYAQYQGRMTAAHGNEEKLSLEGRWSCPGCTSMIELEGTGCGYTVCKTCRFRFCQDCFIPWVGPGSEYDRGAEAHKLHCDYFIKKSKKCLKYKEYTKDSGEQKLDDIDEQKIEENRKRGAEPHAGRQAKRRRGTAKGKHTKMARDEEAEKWC